MDRDSTTWRLHRSQTLCTTGVRSRALAPHAARRAFLLPLILLAFSLASFAPPAMAAESATQRAKQHNEIAKKLFNLGLFAEAAEEYRRAYQAKPLPDFLFNLAQCYKRMTTREQLEKALFYYRSYLNNAPFSPFRPQVEQEIAQIEHQIAELRRPPPFYKRWWFWTAVGVVVGGAAAGTAFALRPEDEQAVMGTASPGAFTLP